MDCPSLCSLLAPINTLSIVYAYIYYRLQNVVIHATVWNIVPQNWNSEHSFNTVRMEYIGEITMNSKSYFSEFLDAFNWPDSLFQFPAMNYEEELLPGILSSFT